MSAITEPLKFTVPFAETGLKNAIPATANNATGKAGFDKGFPERTMLPKASGGIPPSGMDFNGILYDITSAIRYMQAGGKSTYDSAFAAAIGGYPSGAVLIGDDGASVFQNAVDGNATDPNSGGAGWTRPDLQVMELYRRSYAEAGYNVVGTFQAGFTIVNVNDVGIDLATGKGYTGPAGPVAAGTDPVLDPSFYDASEAIYSSGTINLASVMAVFADIGDAVTTMAATYSEIIMPEGTFTAKKKLTLPANRRLVFKPTTKLIKHESLINQVLLKTGNNCEIINPIIDGNFRNFTNQGLNDITLGSTIDPGEFCRVIGGRLDDSESSHIASGGGQSLKVVDVDMGDYQDHFVYTSGKCWGISVTGGAHKSASGREGYKFRGSIGSVIVSGQSHCECVDSIFAIEAETVSGVTGDCFGTVIHKNVPICRGKYYALTNLEPGLVPFEELVTEDVDFVSILTDQADIRKPCRLSAGKRYPFKRLTFKNGRMKNVLPQDFFINYATTYKSVYSVFGTVFDCDVPLTGHVITHGGIAGTDVDIYYNAIESAAWAHERRIDGVDTLVSTGGAQSGVTWLWDLRGNLDQGVLMGINIRAGLARNLIDTRSLTGSVGSLVIQGNNIKCSPSFKIIDNTDAGIRNLVCGPNDNNLDTGTTVSNSGPTANRPVFNSGIRDGFVYFDTTLGKPIYRYNTGWIDGTGAAV